MITQLNGVAQSISLLEDIKRDLNNRKGQEITIFIQERRNLKQNDKYNVLVRELSEITGESVPRIKAMAKEDLGYTEEVQGKKGIITVPISSKDLDKHKMSNLIAYLESELSHYLN